MLIVIGLITWLLIGFAGWRVFSRAGFGGILGLLFLIPVANFVALLYLAHSDWPITQVDKS